MGNITLKSLFGIRSKRHNDIFEEVILNIMIEILDIFITVDEAEIIITKPTFG